MCCKRLAQALTGRASVRVSANRLAELGKCALLVQERKNRLDASI